MISRAFGASTEPVPLPTQKDNANGPKQPKKDPFSNFEVVVNGKRVTDPKEIEKDKEMFENAFSGFDFDFNPLRVAKEIHSMNSGFQSKYALQSHEPSEKRLDPMHGLENLFSDLFGSMENAIKIPNIFQDNFNQRKKKEKQLKDMHKSIMKKSYINGYQKNRSDSKNLDEARVESQLDEDTRGEDLLEKIKDTLDSTEKVERSIDIGNALEGIKNGIQDLENLERLNKEESEDVVGILKSLQKKYKTVNLLAQDLRADFEQVKQMKKKLRKLNVGELRKQKEKEIEELETRLKNNKGRK